MDVDALRGAHLTGALRKRLRQAMYYNVVIRQGPGAMTIAIRLPAKLEADLRARLGARGGGLSDFVRDAIAEKLQREPAEKPSAYDLGKRLFGKQGSGRHDLSSNRKGILSEILRAKHRR
jgi:hypothetical protein